MYIREWKCICPNTKEEGFVNYLQITGIKDTQEIAACSGYKILRRSVNSDVEITFLTYWVSLESMKEYAGDNFYKAVLYPEDDKYQIKPDLEVKVYELIGSNEDS